MTSNAFNSRNGALWIQPDGPNTQPRFLGCHELGDISEPFGSSDLIRCMDRKKGGWKTVGSTSAPPDKVTTSIESLTYEERDYLEDIKCDFTLYALIRSGGEPDIFTNYVRALILSNAKITSLTNSGMVTREEEKAMTESRDIEAYPPVLRTGTLTARRQTTTEANALNDVWFYSAFDCVNDTEADDKGVVGADAALYATADVQLTANGSTWVSCAADPFAAGLNVMSVTAFPMNTTTDRLMVAMEAPAGAQGMIAYSDDGGATWTTVNIGGAAAGHGASDSGALFSLDQSHIWLASALGYIYFSSDGGVTWTAQHAGTLTTENLNCIWFEDESNGMCVGDSDEILVTTDGGTTWEDAGSVTGSGDDLLCVSISGEFWWVGTSTGHLYYSKDEGDTWTERTFAGSGTGSVDDLSFANELIGYFIHTVAGVSTLMVTINGGYDWKEIVTPTNNGLNALFVCDDNTVYAVGEVEGGTAVIVKVTWG